MRGRRGSLMIEVMVTVAISIAVLAGTFATLACVQRRCEASQEKLVANSIAWDALWRAFNAKASDVGYALDLNGGSYSNTVNLAAWDGVAGRVMPGAELLVTPALGNATAVLTVWVRRESEAVLPGGVHFMAEVRWRDRRSATARWKSERLEALRSPLERDWRQGGER